jgi:hypothetical protein
MIHTAEPTSRAAERLAALIDLAHEHDDDLNYAEVEQLMTATRRRLVLRERTQPAQPSRTRADDARPF